MPKDFEFLAQLKAQGILMFCDSNVGLAKKVARLKPLAVIKGG